MGFEDYTQEITELSNNKDFGVLRKTSDNRYIMRTKEKTSIGYFDTNGNLIVESYDDSSDGIVKETYTVVKK